MLGICRRMVVVVLASVVTGCGGGETLDDVARGIRNASLSKKTYDALAHTDDLEAQERAAVNAFCSVAKQLSDNNQTADATAFFDQVRSVVAGVIGDNPSAVELVVNKLRPVVNVAMVDPATAARYVMACGI